jgi:hypothetical protein
MGLSIFLDSRTILELGLAGFVVSQVSKIRKPWGTQIC